MGLSGDLGQMIFVRESEKLENKMAENLEQKSRDELLKMAKDRGLDVDDNASKEELMSMLKGA